MLSTSVLCRGSLVLLLIGSGAAVAQERGSFAAQVGDEAGYAQIPPESAAGVADQPMAEVPSGGLSLPLETGYTEVRPDAAQGAPLDPRIHYQRLQAGELDNKDALVEIHPYRRTGTAAAQGTAVSAGPAPVPVIVPASVAASSAASAEQRVFDALNRSSP